MQQKSVYAGLKCLPTYVVFLCSISFLFSAALKSCPIFMNVGELEVSRDAQIVLRGVCDRHGGRKQRREKIQEQLMNVPDMDA